jgi:type IV secretion system protein TrbL
MGAGFFDVIVGAFVAALQQGFVTLSIYSLPILAFCALVAFCSSMWPVVLGGGDGLAPFLLIVVRIGVFYFFTVSLGVLSIAALNTFLQWGAAPGGGFPAAAFLSPSAIVDVGFRAAFPVQDMLQKFDGWTAIKNFPIVVPYMLAYWLIILAFVLVALHMIITIIEFYFAVMCAAVLFPWGALSHTAFLCEFVVSWVTAGLIRVLLTVGIMAISIPLFEGLRYTVTPGGDPTIYSALIYAATAGVFAILAWVLPNRAAAVGGRGMALGLTGGVLLPHSGVRAIAAGGRGLLTAGRQAIEGGSRMLAARRGGP